MCYLSWLRKLKKCYLSWLRKRKMCYLSWLRKLKKHYLSWLWKIKKTLSEVTQEMKKQAGAELGQAQLKLELDLIEQVMTGRDRSGQGWTGQDI